MKSYWLNKQQNNQLLLFFSGWGSCPAQFESIKAENWDVWMFYDYRVAHLPEDIEEVVSQYERVVLVGWSFGVWMANHLAATLRNKLSCAIAINGTLNPIDDNEGIPVATFKGTLDGLSPRTVEKFTRRMGGGRETAQLLLSCTAQRTFEDLREELNLFSDMLKPEENHLFDRAIIGINDMIFPQNNQVIYWRDKVAIVEMDGSHFVFFDCGSWDELMKDIAE